MERDEIEHQLLDASEQLVQLKQIVKNEQSKQKDDTTKEVNYEEYDDLDKWTMANVEELEKEKCKLEKEVRRLKSELEDERRVIEALMQSAALERETLQKENIAMRTLLNEKGLQIDELSQQLVEMERDAKSKLADLKKENSKYIRTNKSIQEQNDNLKKENKSVHQLKSVVGTLEQDKKALSKRLEKAEFERDEHKFAISSTIVDSVQLKKLNDRLVREIQIERSHATKKLHDDDVDSILRQLSFFNHLLYQTPGTIEHIDPDRLCCICRKPLADALHLKRTDCIMCELLHYIAQVKISCEHAISPSNSLDFSKSVKVLKDRVLVVLVAIISILLLIVLYK